MNTPVEYVIVLVPFTDEEIPEKFPQVRIVRLVVEPQGTSVVQEDGKLVGEATAEKVRGCGHLLLHDPVILLLLCGGLETLPGERTTEEIHEDVSKGFEVVAASLLNTQVSVDGGVTGSASQVLVFPVGNVEVGLRVPVLLGKAEINHIDLVATLPDSHQEVIRLDITVDEIAGVDVLDTRYLWRMVNIRGLQSEWRVSAHQLISEQQNCLEREFTVAEVEEVFEGRTKEVDDHCVVVTFGAEPPDKRDADTTSKCFVDLRLVLKLGMFGFDRLELDGDFFTGYDVDSEIDITCHQKGE